MDFTKHFFDEEKKIWSGPKAEEIFNPDISIGRIVFRFLQNHPNNVLQISASEGTTLTNRDVFTAAIRIAQHFKKMGLTHEDVIGIVGNNTTYVLPLFAACIFNCTPYHGVNPRHDEKTFRHILGITKPKVIFCDGQCYEKLRVATQSFQPIFYTIFEHLEGVPSVLDLLEPTETELMYSPEFLTLGRIQTIAILNSSGTTGLPKAICLSNEYALYAYYSIRLTNSEAVVFCTTGFDWFTGFLVLLGGCMVGCTCIISHKPFCADDYIDIVHKHKVNITILAPCHVAAVVKSPKALAEYFTSMRYINAGGGLITLSNIRTLHSLAKNSVFNYSYGMTETGAVASNLDKDKMPAVGKLFPGIRVRIVDDESSQNLGSNEIGEIYVHNGQKWLGYYNNPQATNATRDSDGWIHTGDMGYFDNQHNLYIVDRKKDIMKYNGLMFWPSEIESCIMEIPDVEEACVVCIFDECCGDKAGALVVKTKGSKLSGRDIEDYLVKNLVVPQKQIYAGVLFVDSLPQILNGKTDKKQAKALLLAAVERGEL